MFVVFFRASAALSVDYWTLFLHVAFIIVFKKGKFLCCLLYMLIYLEFMAGFFFLALMYYGA